MSFAYVDYDFDVGSSVSDVTLSWPAAAAAGDLGIALIARGTSEINPSSTPSGWTEMGGRVNRSDYGPEYICIFYKVMESGDRNAVWNWSANNKSHGHLAVFRDGFNPLDPIRDYGSFEYTILNTTLRTYSAYAEENSPVIIMPVTYNLSLNLINSFPAGWTAHDQSSSTSSDMVVRPASRVATTAGAVGNVDATTSRSDNDKHGFMIALNPPLGGADARRFFMGQSL